MRKLVEWVTAHPLRGFIAAGVAAFVALPVLPMTAWLPGAVVVLTLLTLGPGAAGITMLGAGLLLFWGFTPATGTAIAAGIAVLVLVPAYLAGMVLAASRSLSFAYQSATLGACVLLLAIHGLLGDPLEVLAPVVGYLAPMLEQTAAALARFGIESSPQELGEATVRVAWATLAWLILLHATLASFGGLWAFGMLREPGLFRSEFRELRLGHFVAWLAVGVFAFTAVAALVAGESWQVADDLRFVLAAAFLVQALAVVHALRDAQVIGLVSVVCAYLSIVVLPVALVGIGLADTWVRFRERFTRPAASN